MRISASSFAAEVHLGRQAAEVVVDDLGPGRAAELLVGVAQQVEELALFREGDRRTPVHVVDHTEHGHDRRRVDRRLTGLVVERDVAAGDRGAQLQAAVRETTGGLGELPHDVRVLGEPKLRQSEMASGLAPEAATLRYDSASASCAPVYGSSLAYRPLPSVAIATPRFDSASMRTMPASSGIASTVLPCTKRSYWSVIHALEAWFGRRPA